MKKIVLVLAMALGLVGCQKEELDESLQVKSLIEVMEENEMYERTDIVDAGLRIRNGQRISQIYESNSDDCFIEKALPTGEFRLTSSDSTAYSYVIKTDIGNVYEYAFRSMNGNSDDMTLTVYEYDEEYGIHTLLLEIEYVKTNRVFNICN